MADLTARVEADIKCAQMNVDVLCELATTIDKSVDASAENRLAEAVSIVLNRGTSEQIQAAFALMKGWSFKPRKENL